MIEDLFDTWLHGPRLISGVTTEIVTSKSDTGKRLGNNTHTLFGGVTINEDQSVPAGMLVITVRDKNDKTLKSI